MPPKGSSTGPKGTLGQEELAGLGQEARAYRPIREREVDEAVQAWFRLYHSVVLLAAATNSPQNHSLNERDD